MDIQELLPQLLQPRVYDSIWARKKGGGKRREKERKEEEERRNEVRPVTVFLVLRLSLPTPSHVGHPLVPGAQGAMPPAATTFDRVFWPQNCTCEGEERQDLYHISN